MPSKGKRIKIKKTNNNNNFIFKRKRVLNPMPNIALRSCNAIFFSMYIFIIHIERVEVHAAPATRRRATIFMLAGNPQKPPKCVYNNDHNLAASIANAFGNRSSNSRYSEKEHTNKWLLIFLFLSSLAIDCTSFRHHFLCARARVAQRCLHFHVVQQFFKSISFIEELTNVATI